jgi:hypothetical protein
MTWWTGVPQERRAEFAAELQRRLDADQVPYRVGKARHRGGLVFRCRVKGRDRRARQAQAEAFDHCSIHEQLLRLEMFGEQPSILAIRYALAFLVALLLPQRSSPESVARTDRPNHGEAGMGGLRAGTELNPGGSGACSSGPGANPAA